MYVYIQFTFVVYIWYYIYQGATGLIRVKTGSVWLRSRFDWVTFVKYVHGLARVGIGQVLSLPWFGQVGFVWF